MPGLPCSAVLHYAGQGFAGWQRQKSRRTVQGELEAVLKRLCRQRVVTHAAGRTDAGVHAIGQVVSFSMPGRWTPTDVRRALNALLPKDVWVARVDAAPEGFHARKHATSRRYRYVIGCDDGAASPFRRVFEWALGTPLDPAGLAEGAHFLGGEHDFRGFASAGPVKPHYRCRVTHAHWEARRNAEGFIFDIEADRFLHHMVRFLVGTMVDIGRGRRPASDIERLLARRDSVKVSSLAPPEGLYLMEVTYPQPGSNA